MRSEMYSHIHHLEQTHWWYTARREIIFDWVFQILAQYPTPKLLDIGCGTGFNIAYLQQHHYQDVIGLDFSSEALQFCQSRHLSQLIQGDGTRPPLRLNTFDVILALDLIEHLEDDVQALQALAHLLKPKGTLLIFTPAFNFLWGLQDEVSHHYRRYTAAELCQKLGRVNLTIQKLTYTNTFLFGPIWLGRQLIKRRGNTIQGTSENDLHPAWSNSLLQRIFRLEKPLLRYVNLPFGVSLLCIAQKSET